MRLVIALQEVYSLVDGNNTIHSFLDFGIVYKCGDFINFRANNNIQNIYNYNRGDLRDVLLH
jgi:hypothetical protein